MRSSPTDTRTWLECAISRKMCPPDRTITEKPAASRRVRGTRACDVLMLWFATDAVHKPDTDLARNARHCRRMSSNNRHARTHTYTHNTTCILACSLRPDAEMNSELRASLHPCGSQRAPALSKIARARTHTQKIGANGAFQLSSTRLQFLSFTKTQRATGVCVFWAPIGRKLIEYVNYI